MHDFDLNFMGKKSATYKVKGRHYQIWRQITFLMKFEIRIFCRSQLNLQKIDER